MGFSGLGVAAGSVLGMQGRHRSRVGRELALRPGFPTQGRIATDGAKRLQGPGYLTAGLVRIAQPMPYPAEQRSQHAQS